MRGFESRLFVCTFLLGWVQEEHCQDEIKLRNGFY